MTIVPVASLTANELGRLGHNTLVKALRDRHRKPPQPHQPTRPRPTTTGNLAASSSHR